MARQKMFKNLKLQEKYAMFLKETLKAVEVDSRSGKYVVLKTVDSKGDLFWFLGKGGAVRICRSNAATKSMDFSNQIKSKLKFDQWNDMMIKKEID